MAIAQQPRIDETTWYTGQDLIFRFGIPEQTQAQARREGRLLFNQRGSVYLHLGGWVADFLRSEQRRQQQQATTQPTTTPANRSPGVPLASRGNTPMMNTDPIAAFEKAVEEKMRAGMPKPRAVRQVVVENPELHTAYLQAYNQRHAAARHPSKRGR